MFEKVFEYIGLNEPPYKNRNIYDCFAFYNEMDLLEIRLNELDPVVHKFVLVEATKTYSGKDKPLYFNENKERYKKFLPKIEHIIVDDLATDDKDRWVAENDQRNRVVMGLKDANPEDLILISDLDEIPKPHILENLYISNKPVAFIQNFYCYFANLQIPSEKWPGTIGITKKYLDKTKPQVLRDRRYRLKAIKNSGWHFTYIGGIEWMILKIESFAHSEYDEDYWKDPERIKQCIKDRRDLFERGNEKFQLIELNETFPKYLLNNQDKFKYMICSS